MVPLKYFSSIFHQLQQTHKILPCHRLYNACMGGGEVLIVVAYIFLNKKSHIDLYFI